MNTVHKEIIHTLFEEKAAAVPTRIAVEEAHAQISYGELNAAANRLAQVLRSLGTRKDSVVGVFAPAGIPLVTSLLSILKAGGIYLPLSSEFSKKRLQQIMEQTQPDILLTTPEWLPRVQLLMDELRIPLRYLIVLHEPRQLEVWAYQPSGARPYALPEQDFTEENPAVTSQPDDGNYIFYTSGSTGEAKAILGKHESLSQFIRWEIKEFVIDSSCRVSQLISATFDASLRDILVPLCAGGTLCIPSEAVKVNPFQLIQWIEQAAITLMHTVPSVFRLLTKEAESETGRAGLFPQLKHILLSGEALYGKDIVRWRNQVGNHVELVNLYGPTETTMVKTFYRIGEITGDAAAVLPVGKPMDQTLVAIINHNHICKVGEIGDVYIKTPYATKGYYKSEALTRTVFVPNPLGEDAKDIVYKTGDIGRYRPDKTIEILGRLDEQVKVNGIRVELNEVKQALLGVEGIREALVVARKNQDNQMELLAYYTGKSFGYAALRQELKSALNENIFPAYCLHLEAFPLNLNGKVNKKALPQPEDIALADQAFEEGQTATEKKLVGMWKDLLSVERLSVNTAFFSVGGTSLKAIQLISRIAKELDVMVGIKDVFSNPSVKQLAQVVDQAQKKAYEEIPAVLLQTCYEVSQAQKRLWIMNQFEEEQVAFNVTGAYELEGQLDRAALERALAILVQRHESLRTTFVTVEGEPKQKIHPVDTFGFALSWVDLRTTPDAEKVASEIADAEANTVFDLEKGPLLRTTLVQLDETRYAFLLTMHHIISDGWSVEVIIHESLTLYNAFQAGKPNPLSPLKIQYKDFTAWSNRLLSGNRLQEHRQYWLKQFENDIPLLELVTDFPRPAIRSYQGNTTHFVIDPTLTRRINEVCRQNDATLFMVLLAATHVFLYRYSGQTDIVIGTPMAGRNHQDLEGQIGFYINMLPLKTAFDPQQSFQNLLLAVKQTALGAYAHDTYPFIQLVEDLKLGSNQSRTNLFDVVVQMQDAQPQGLQTPSLAGIQVKEFRAAAQASKYDLTFNFMPTDHHIAVGIEYSTGLFRDATLEKMKAQFLALLEAAIQYPVTSVNELKKRLLDDQEDDQLNSYAQYISSEINEEF